MFEPDLKYCPQCKDEYISSIEKCHDCGCILLTGGEMSASGENQRGKRAQRLGELGPDDELVVVRRGPLPEMKVYEELLRADSIATALAGDESSCGKGCCASSFDLVVRREEAADAMQIIEAEIRRTAVIDSTANATSDSVFDPLAANNICPACGHRFTGGMECPDCGLCF